MPHVPAASAWLLTAEQSPNQVVAHHASLIQQSPQTQEANHHLRVPAAVIIRGKLLCASEQGAVRVS